jgi:hypothetical protein
MSDAAPSPASPPEEEAAGRRFELISGLTLAVLAAVLAVVDLGGGKYGDDEIIGTNEKPTSTSGIRPIASNRPCPSSKPRS